MKKCPSCNLEFEVEARHITTLEHTDLHGHSLGNLLLCVCPSCSRPIEPTHKGEQQTWERMREYLDDHR